jgi:hypothetical protein
MSDDYRPPGYTTGRPTKYRPQYAEIAGNLCRLLAYTDRQIADAFGVEVSTISNWKLDHPEFLEALKENKEVADQNVVNALYQRAIGYDVTVKRLSSERDDAVVMEETKHYPPDPTSMIFWLKNRRPKEWTDKKENEPQSVDALIAALAEISKKLPG